MPVLRFVVRDADHVEWTDTDHSDRAAHVASALFSAGHGRSFYVVDRLTGLTVHRTPYVLPMP